MLHRLLPLLPVLAGILLLASSWAGFVSKPAQAAEECGPLDPTTDTGRSIVCTGGEAGNYDPAERNIYYELPETDAKDAKYEFEVRDGVVISGRRSNKGQARDRYIRGAERRPSDYPIEAERNRLILDPNEPDTVNYGPGPGDDGSGQNDPQDDHGRRNYMPGGVLGDPKTPVSGQPPNTRYGGIFIDTHHEFEGDIRLESQATITVDNEPFSTDDAALRKQRREGVSADASATGISVLHYGKSGDLDLDIGGRITSPGEGVRAEIDSLADKVQGSEFRDIDFTGDINIRLLPGVTIRTSWEDGDGIQAWNRGTGDVTVTASETALSATPDIQTAGHDASGISVETGGYYNTPQPGSEGGDVRVDLRNFHIKTTGGFGTDSGRSFGPPRDRSWEGSRGLKIYNFQKGRMDIDLTGSRIETEGVRGQGIYAAYFAAGSKAGGPMDIDVTDSKIGTGGNYADAILGYHGSTGNVDIDVRDGSEITTTGTDAHAIAGLHHGTGDVGIVVDGSTISTTGQGSDGIRGGHRGAGNIRITARNADIRTSGDRADGIFAFNLGDAAVVRESGDGTGDLTRHEQTMPPPVIVYGDSGPWGLFAAPGAPTVNPELRIDVMDTRIDASQGHAVKFEGARGVLTLSDNRLLRGDISFADGAFDDELTIRQTRSGSLDGVLDFGDGNDRMTIDIAKGRHLVFEGQVQGGTIAIDKQGGGHARFADRVIFRNGTLTLNEGVLVLAEDLHLGDGALIVRPAGRLVFEAGLESDGVDFGQLFAGRLRFADLDAEDAPAVFLQLSEDLSPDEIERVRSGFTVDSSQLIHSVSFDPITQSTAGSDQETPVSGLVLRSEQADGTVSEIGTVSGGGVITSLEGRDRIAPLNLPETPGAAAGPTSGSTSGGGGGSGGGPTVPEAPIPSAGDTEAPTWLTLTGEPSHPHDRIVSGVYGFEMDCDDAACLLRNVVLEPRARVYEALPSILLDMNEVQGRFLHRDGTGTWGGPIAAERDLKDANTSYGLTRNGLILGHDFRTSEDGTFGLSVHNQAGAARIDHGGEIDTMATGVSVSHRWDLAPLALGLNASASSFSSTLTSSLRGRLATGLSGTGHAVGVEAGVALTDTLLTLGLTHKAVQADGFTSVLRDPTRGTAAVRVADIRGEETMLRLGADYRNPAGALFVGLDLPLDSEAEARVGNTRLSSRSRASAHLQGSLAFDGAVLSLGYATTGDDNSVRAGLTVRF